MPSIETDCQQSILKLQLREKIPKELMPMGAGLLGMLICRLPNAALSPYSENEAAIQYRS
ncbi:hypothetical protein SAMN05216198_1185 [Halopseudomonas litoralis]|uniref:Uncharacterized protein n=1 Tax=Halopseudomonas litoralis TaxID=797277 RepID=A0A1H1PH45_9GAMM|nr:hypothetical protein SAMN05216198_1185 [Halopseudomonas litoralis]